MSTATPTSMNSASDRDPHNNNCYGTLLDADYLQAELPVLDVNDFNDRIIQGYEDGTGPDLLPADVSWHCRSA